MVQVFTQPFNFPNLNWTLVLIAIGLALVFAAVWLAGYMPPLLKKRWLWVVAILSAFLTWTCIAFIQVPLQLGTDQLMLMFWPEKTLQGAVVYAGIPGVLISGLVQEAAKLAPVIVFWWLDKRRMDPQTGLIAGAISGAGFGVFEAVWIHNSIFAGGLTWQLIVTNGPLALLGFWERFFTIGFHIAVCALAGYGLARGRGWQFYLLASLVHGTANYGAVLYQAKIFNVITVEIYIAIVAVIVTAAVMWLKWRGQGPKVNIAPNMPPQT